MTSLIPDPIFDENTKTLANSISKLVADNIAKDIK